MLNDAIVGQGDYRSRVSFGVGVEHHRDGFGLRVLRELSGLAGRHEPNHGGHAVDHPVNLEIAVLTGRKERRLEGWRAGESINAVR